jgi:DNA-binding transcriptional LysR family regulator
MALSSLYLEAFMQVALDGHFSRAAEKLHITQSALSQRILNLESELGATLLVREASGIRLTQIGSELLRFCRSKESLEQEFFQNFKTSSKGLAGTIRMAGFSTVMRSIILPVLSEFVKEHQEIQLEVSSKEIRELPSLLESGEVDYLILNKPLAKQGITNLLVGYEEYVLIQSKNAKSRASVFLDHDSEDTTTEEFWRIQKTAMPKFKRSYLDEIYSLLDGVELGLGKAVVPKHLVKDLKSVEIVSGFKKLKTPVCLSFYDQPIYTELHKKLSSFLEKRLQEMF